MGGIGVVIPHHVQSPLGIALDKRIGAFLVRIVQGLEFLVRHVFRIKTGTRGLGAETVDKRLSVNAVPGTVVDIGELTLRRREGTEESLVPEDLLPVNGVGLVGGETVQIQNLLSIVGDSRKVRSGNGHLSIVLKQAFRLAATFLARPEGRCGKQEDSCHL